MRPLELLIASRQLTGVNHVVVPGAPNHKTFCGEAFLLPDGKWDDIMTDPVQRARLCPKCVEGMRVSKTPIPDDRHIPNWREHPSF